MSAASFTLTLDITSPQLEIYAPSYTTKEIQNEIRIVSNEQLSQFQEIYIIDSSGTKHDFTFSHQGDEFIGLVTFSNLSLGIAIIYTRLMDTVDNLSLLYSKPINIVDSVSATRLYLTLEEFVCEFDLENTSMEIHLDESAMVLDIEIE